MNQQHWSVNTEKFRREDPTGFEKWALEQRINFGISESDDGKISEASLRRYWGELTLDPAKKRFLEFLLWNQPSSPNASSNS